MEQKMADYQLKKTDSCINDLRRFICRHAQVTNIKSDNGTNFMEGEKELEKEQLRLH